MKIKVEEIEWTPGVFITVQGGDEDIQFRVDVPKGNEFSLDCVEVNMGYGWMAFKHFKRIHPEKLIEPE